MPNDVFADVHDLIARGHTAPALVRTHNLISSGIGAVPQALVDEQRRLTALYKAAAGKRLTPSFRNDLIALVTELEIAWLNLPKPFQVAAPAPAGPKSQLAPTDRREAKLIGSPLRRVAWLTAGLKASEAVCRLIVDRLETGTGFVVKGGLLITNHHVLPTQQKAAVTEAEFNYQEGLNGRALPTSVFALDPSIFETDPQLDCTVVGLKATANELEPWGHLEFETEDAVEETESVSIIQHPDGSYKRIALSGSVVTDSADPTIVRYYTSTNPGSSGSPVLNEKWKVVAIHRAAGQFSDKSKLFLNNEGVRSSVILAQQKFSALLT